jgi:transposase
MTDKPIIGIDVSKDWLDLCSNASGTVERIANDREAIGAWLDREGPSLAAFEPTGGYEQTLIAALRAREIVFTRVHPNAVLAFRKSRGIRAKTDKIDARLILEFVLDAQSRGRRRVSIVGDELLRALAARRRQLADTLQAERCRLALAVVPGVRASIERVIAVLRDSLAALEGELDAAIAANPDSAELSKLLPTIFGVGRVVAATLIADLPELGLLSAKEIAALAGLAPHTKRSGKTRYREPTGHGRAGVRRALFNAARAAIRHPSPFREFYDRLVGQNRRPGKVALTAVMRKILVTANAVARDRQPWRPTPAGDPRPKAAGTPCRPHAKPAAHRAGRVKATAAPRAVARSASLDAA